MWLGRRILWRWRRFRVKVGPASDVYSLSATLFALIAGEPPFTMSTASNKDAHEIRLELEHRCEPELPDHDCWRRVPDTIEQLIRRGLAYQWADRPSSAEFAVEASPSIEPASDGPPKTRASGTGGPRRGKSHNGSQQARQRWPISPTQQSAARPQRFLRDAKIVPQAPSTVTLSTGDLLQIETEVSEDGYLTIFNIGPTGNLNLLYPDSDGQRSQAIACRPLVLPGIQLIPRPVGSRFNLVTEASRALGM